MLYKDIKSIVNSTLKIIGYDSPEYENLICGTFAIESQLDSLIGNNSVGPNAPRTRMSGFMQMPRTRLESVIGEYMWFHPVFVDGTKEATGIDIKVHSFDELEFFAQSNVAFMTILTLCAYFSEECDEPASDDLELLGKYYIRYYDKFQNGITVEDFAQAYSDVFE